MIANSLDFAKKVRYNKRKASKKGENPMKITPQILSIPPYLSTTWSEIASMFVKEESSGLSLTIVLQGGHQVIIPSLSQAVITAIFDAHAKYIHSNTTPKIETHSDQERPSSFGLTLPFTQSDGNTIDVFGSAAEHNPAQAHFPPLPPMVLKKIAAIAQALGLNFLPNFSKAEPGCNCVFCQVVNAMRQDTPVDAVQEEVSDQDLQFRSWDIHQTAEKLYSVTNPLDANEHYSVFLGEPLGCTCGAKNCEHIRAVLNT